MASSGSGSAGSADAATARKHTKRPKYSKFTQQELPACKPILTPRAVISSFLIVSVFFIPIGVACLLASNDVVEIIDRYDSDCIPENFKNNKVGYIQSSVDKTCNRTLNVTKHMKSPIYVYYELDNFYQNHRRYVKSRNDAQLRDPKKADSTEFLNKKGISWKSDREHKFGKDVFPKNFQNSSLIGGARLNESIPLSEQEDLIVWMRTAALPTFRKLYGRIEVDLNAGDQIHVTLKNYYNTYSFNGKKMLVLSTTTWLGGKNNFLGIAYLSIGGLCFFLAMAFTIIYFIKPRQLGDPSYLSWNRSPGGQ
ncbi:hypothetical protein K1719_012448 [Acacia pycnantha]|nr:hypothetical protein K1719_012448 [Acacia pycnantha]